MPKCLNVKTLDFLKVKKYGREEFILCQKHKSETNISLPFSLGEKKNNNLKSSIYRCHSTCCDAVESSQQCMKMNCYLHFRVRTKSKLFVFICNTTPKRFVLSFATLPYWQSFQSSKWMKNWKQLKKKKYQADTFLFVCLTGNLEEAVAAFLEFQESYFYYSVNSGLEQRQMWR